MTESPRNRLPVAPQGRNNRGRFTEAEHTAERDAAACSLRVRGKNYRQIAEELGYYDHTHARRAVQRALKATVAEPAEEVRQLELERLDQMWQAALYVLEQNHIVVSNGKVMTVDGVTLDDPTPVLAALDRMLRISGRRAELLGLDAPRRSSVSVVSESTVDAAIRELEEELSERADDADDRRSTAR